MSINISNLPVETLTHIFNFLSESEVLTAATVSKDFQKLANTLLQTEWSAILRLAPGRLVDKAHLIEKTNPDASTLVKMKELARYSQLPQVVIPTAKIIQETQEQNCDSALICLWKTMRNDHPNLPDLKAAAEISVWFKQRTSLPILAKITLLDLSGLGLTTLPSEINRLLNLTRLDLSNNQLQTLPKEIADMPKLENLSLANNKFQTLPNFLRNLVNLKNLCLIGNEIRDVPKFRPTITVEWHT